jgi:hypothetical protein
LQSVPGKLEILFAKNSKLTLIPADVSIRVEEFVSDEAKIKKILIRLMIYLKTENPSHERIDRRIGQ